MKTPERPDKILEAVTAVRHSAWIDPHRGTMASGNSPGRAARRIPGHIARTLLAVAMLAAGTAGFGAAPVTISASVSGDINDIVTFQQNVNPATGEIVDGANNPIPLDELDYLTYGDFMVNGGNDLGATVTTVGDGINDETWWVFDFTGDSAYAAFVASSEPMSSALLTLTLIPRENPPRDDSTFVPGLNGGYDVLIPDTVAIGQATTLSIELVRPDLVATGNAHEIDDILNMLFESGSTGPSNALTYGAGQLPFKFIDDAQVTAASLTFTRGVTLLDPREAMRVQVLQQSQTAFEQAIEVFCQQSNRRLNPAFYSAFCNDID